MLGKLVQPSNSEACRSGRKGTSAGPASRAFVRFGLKSCLRYFAVGDRYKIDGGLVLRAFLAGRPLLDEVDVAIHPLHLDVPQRGADGFRVRLAGGLDRGVGDVDAVIAAEAFGQAADVVAPLLPLVHVALGSVRVLRRLREPWREEHSVERAVGCI